MAIHQTNDSDSQISSLSVRLFADHSLTTGPFSITQVIDNGLSLCSSNHVGNIVAFSVLHTCWRAKTYLSGVSL